MGGDGSTGSPGPLDRVQRYHRLSLFISGLAGGLPALTYTVTSGWAVWQVLLFGGLVVAVTARRLWWLATALAPRSGRPPGVREQLLVILVASALSAAGAGHDNVHVMLWALLPAGVLSAVVVLRRHRPSDLHWWAGATAAAAYVVTALLLAVPLTRVVHALGLTGGVVLSVVLLEGSQVWSWSVVNRVDRNRRMAAELAVARERLRFAGDLHDIQGHYLQAICLKGEIAARLVGVDDGRARDAAQDISTLARRALADTRAVVQGYRTASLPQEVHNAVGILQAAGTSAAVTGDPTAVTSPVAVELLGRLVREAATNILRHADARHCEIAVRLEDGDALLSIWNDGVRDGTTSAAVPGSGLAGLRERFTDHGAELEVRRGSTSFEVAGRVPAVLGVREK